MPQLSLHAPLGALTMTEEDGAIVALDWGWGRDQTETALLRAAVRWLDAYFDGSPEAFPLPLNPHGTAYQQRLWQGLLAIPFGTVRTYGAMAAAIGGSARSVWGAAGANPIPIIIPCHRVVAKGGLGGYSGDGGPTDKRFLLTLENATLPAGNAA